jgi:hypothetical protein
MGRSWPTLRTDDFYRPPRGVPKVIEATARFIRRAGHVGRPVRFAIAGEQPFPASRLQWVAHKHTGALDTPDRILR